MQTMNRPRTAIDHGADWIQDYIVVSKPLHEKDNENLFEAQEVDSHFLNKNLPKLSTTPQIKYQNKLCPNDLRRKRASTLNNFPKIDNNQESSMIRSHIRNKRLTNAPSKAFANYTNKVLKTYEKLYQKESKYEDQKHKEKLAYLNRKTDIIGRVSDNRITEEIVKNMRKLPEPSIQATKLPHEPSLLDSDKHRRIFYWG